MGSRPSFIFVHPKMAETFNQVKGGLTVPLPPPGEEFKYEVDGFVCTEEGYCVSKEHKLEVKQLTFPESPVKVKYNEKYREYRGKGKLVSTYCSIPSTFAFVFEKIISELIPKLSRPPEGWDWYSFVVWKANEKIEKKWAPDEFIYRFDFYLIPTEEALGAWPAVIAILQIALPWIVRALTAIGFIVFATHMKDVADVAKSTGEAVQKAGKGLTVPIALIVIGLIAYFLITARRD